MHDHALHARLIPLLFRPLLAAAALALPLLAEAAPPTTHRHVEVDGVRIFYREAGPKDAPHVLLLHGFPSSSHMFRDLIPALADRYPRRRPGLPGLRAQRHARARRVRLHLRSPRRRHRHVHGARRPRPLRALRPGLRRADRLPARRPAPRAHPRPRHPERQRLRRGPARVLGSDQGLLAGSDRGRTATALAKALELESHAVAVPARRAAARAHQPRRLADRSGAARSPRQQGDPAAAVLQLRHATRRSTRAGRPTSAGTSRRRSSCGAGTIRSSRPKAHAPTRAT